MCMEAKETLMPPTTPASEAGETVPSYTNTFMEPQAAGGVVLPQMMNMTMSMNMERNLGGDLVKKRRGRPRKYAVGTTTTTTATSNSMPVSLSPLYSSPSPSLFSPKRGRGRPRGSGKRQLLASFGDWGANSAGGNFTPHVVTIGAGENVATKILSFSQKGPRSICILSANGAISSVTLRQPGSSGGILTYEGRFEILSLSGSFIITENGGVRSRTGGISVSLAGPDGRVVGGGVAGLLLAASPIQIVVGSFMHGINKEQKRKPNPESSIASTHPPGLVAVTAAQPISHMNPDDSRGTPRSAMPSQAPTKSVMPSQIPTRSVMPSQTSTRSVMPSQIPSNAENSTSHHPNMYSASFPIAGWPGSQSMPEERSSPDINVCLPGV